MVFFFLRFITMSMSSVVESDLNVLVLCKNSILNTATFFFISGAFLINIICYLLICQFIRTLDRVIFFSQILISVF